jgi:hypothetical protein
MKAYWECGILDLGTRCEESASRPGLFTLWEEALGTLWIGGWVDPRAGLDAVVQRKSHSSCRDSNHRLSIP